MVVATPEFVGGRLSKLTSAELLKLLLLLLLQEEDVVVEPLLLEEEEECNRERMTLS